MNAFYSKVFSLLALLCGTLGVLAAPSEAEYGKLHETWTLHEDGSQEYRCAQELTLFTHTAMNGTYGETFIVYNPHTQKLVIHDSYTRQKDGNVVRTPENAFVEVLPRHAAGAPDYNHLKEMVIVHTGLELGATIVLDYSIISQPGYLPELDVYRQLSQSSPVKEYTLTFIAPAGKPMHYQSLATKAKPTESTQERQQQLQWTFRNLPAFSRESAAGVQNGDVPALLLTTYPSARAALQTLYKQFDAANSPEMVALTKQLTKDCKTDTEKIRAIQEYVITHYDFCPLTLSETGYRLRNVSAMQKTAYGTATEKINLMIALLQAANIQAAPVAVYPLPIAPEHAALSAIGQLIVVAEADDRRFELTPTQMAKAPTDNCVLLDLADAGLIPTDESPDEIHYKAAIHWKDGKPHADIEASFSNRQVPYIADFAPELLPMNTGYQVKTDKKTTTVTGHYTPQLSTEKDYTLLTLPATYEGIAETTGYTRYNSKRHSNLLLPTLVNEEYNYTLALPDNLQLCTPEKEIKIDNAVGSLTLSLKQDGSVFHIRRTLQLHKKLITPTDYPAFRQLMTEWGDKAAREMLVKKR